MVWGGCDWSRWREPSWLHEGTWSKMWRGHPETPLPWVSIQGSFTYRLCPWNSLDYMCEMVCFSCLCHFIGCLRSRWLPLSHFNPCTLGHRFPRTKKAIAGQSLQVTSCLGCTLRATTWVPEGLWEQVSGLRVESVPFCNLVCLRLLDRRRKISPASHSSASWLVIPGSLQNFSLLGNT